MPRGITVAGTGRSSRRRWRPGARKSNWSLPPAMATSGSLPSAAPNERTAGSAPLGSADRWNDLGLERLGRDRPDVSVGDAARAIDDEGLGHAVDTPLDGGPAVAVRADGDKRIAVAAEEAPRGCRLILVIDAEHAHAGLLLEPHQNGMLFNAWDAPRSPEVDDGDLALREIQTRKAGDRVACPVGQALDRFQLRRGRHLADQGGRQLGGIASAQGKDEERGKDHEDRQRPDECARSPASWTGR